VKVSEFIRQIKKQGVKLYNHDKKHDVYINTKTGEKTRVPRHSSQELGVGIVEQMLKDLGLK